MARIRSIKPEFWTNEKVLNVKAITRLLFIGMWNFADDYGRLPFAPSTLKAQIFPGDDLSAGDVKDMLAELSSVGLILVYSVNDREYLEITGWNHQKIDRRGESKYPAPFVEDSSSKPRALAPDLILSEGKGIVSDARDETQKRIGDFRQAIVKAYEAANSPTLPDTSRAALWISLGYQEDICLAVISGIVPKKPNVSLNYFDNPIKEAHASKAPPRKSVEIVEPTAADWDAICISYKRFGHWSRQGGSSPDSGNCRCPPEILAKHGIVVASPADVVAVPSLARMQ